MDIRYNPSAINIELNTIYRPANDTKKKKKANNLENSYWGVTFIFITVYNKFVYKMRPNRP